MVVLLLAVAIDILLGDPPNRFHPVAAMGKYVRWMADHAPVRGKAGPLLFGFVLTLAGGALFSLPPAALDRFLRPFSWPSIVIDAVMLKAVISLRRLVESGHEVERALQTGNLSAARDTVSFHLVSRDTSALDEGHVASATVESLAENLSDSFVAPLLAYLVCGLPLAWVYRFVNTADAMIGYRDEKHEYLGKFAARLDDALNWIPARVSGLFIVLAAPLTGCRLKAAWRTMILQHARTPSPNAGWPMAAAAGALGVALEKPAQYRLEGGVALPDATAIRKARHLVLWAAGLGSSVALALHLIHHA